MAFSSSCARCLLLLSVALLPLGMAMDPIGNYCARNNYPANSKAVANINSVLGNLVATASTGGYATSTVGRGNNVIYGLAQCRGDVSAGDCAACLADAASQLPSTCGYTSDARIWYDYCFVRYENANFFGQQDTDNGVVLVNVQAQDNAKAFAKAVGKLMGRVTAQAAAAGSAGLGRDKEKYTPFVTVYGLAQCTRDLAPLSCAQCLSTAVSQLGVYCGAQQGCQINYSTCRVRYEIYPFYFPLAGARGLATTDMTKYNKIAVHA